MAHQGSPVGFKTAHLFKDQTLGIGAYGKVCKAKCDDLLCAAKLIHETLFDPTAQQLIAPQREHRLPMRRFEQECEFLSTIRHPNIVQYLGICRDSDTGLPALLMELMDDSLTHFLESSPQPIPYHIQVNICHDITLALSFLHSNGIVHRDLSGNNVLLIGNMRAKVTDFGMARLGDQNPRATQLTFTMCPGTDVYMPPEAVQEEPVYTEKIDCFSFGVIIVQILTQEFPNPGNRRRKIQIDQPGLPSGTMAEVPTSEIERRQNQISKIDPSHTLLQVALDCLKDRGVERPSAQQLCERIVILKRSTRYEESVREMTHTLNQSVLNCDRSRELRLLQQRNMQQVQNLQQIIQSKDNQLVEKERTIAELVNENHHLEAEKNQAIEESDKLKKDLEHANQQLEESEETMTKLQKEIEKLRPPTKPSSSSKWYHTKWQKSESRINLTWRYGEKPPHEYMYYPNNTAVDGSMFYVRTGCKVYTYSADTLKWSVLPDCRNTDCPAVIVNSLLTLVGGKLSGTLTNQLFSLVGEEGDRKWIEEFPPMPTERCDSVALCAGAGLIVAGGVVDKSNLTTVEVLNTVTLQWSTAADLPLPDELVSYGPGVVCGSHIYIFATTSSWDPAPTVVYTCSINAIVYHTSTLTSLWNRYTGLWKTIEGPPVVFPALVSVYDRLLAIGGRKNYYAEECTTVVHMYNSTTNSWKVISNMYYVNLLCIAAVLPDNQLVVVAGGQTQIATID